jgi:Tol biopolymer transport system component
MILGTAAYMAPEQARGKAVDRRADIWAFGVVLYEMLTGKQLFQGETISDVLAGVLAKEPDLSAAPTKVRRLLSKCLEKDPKRRLQAIGDWKLALEGGATEALPPARPRAAWLPWTLAGTLALAALGFAGLWLRPAPLPQVVRFEIHAPPGSTLPLGTPAISPDGRMIAYTVNDPDGKSRIHLRLIDHIETRVLAGTEGAVHPFWSPDGRSLAFATVPGLVMKRIDVDGGAPRDLAAASAPWQGAWGQSGDILFSTLGSLSRVSAQGGLVTLVVSRDPDLPGHPFYLPDGKRFLVYMRRGGRGSIQVATLGSMNRTMVLAVDSAPILAPTPRGKTYLLYLRGSDLFAQEFDQRSGAVRGSPMLVVSNIGRVASPPVRAAVGVSATGVLAYQTGGAAQTGQLTWLDRSGKQVESLPADASGVGPQLSPDDLSVAMSRTDASGNEDVWVTDLVRRSSTRLTFDPGSDFSPVWSPDGKRLAFLSLGSPQGIHVVDANDGAKQQLLIAPRTMAPSSSSPDGKYLLAAFLSGKMTLVPLTGNGKPMPFGSANGNSSQGRFSADGRYIAFTSDQSGRNEVYVQPMPPATGQWKVSIEGGSQPHWRRDGKELFYVSPEGAMMAVDVKPGETFYAGIPRQLFQVKGIDLSNYDVRADGQQFLVFVPQGGTQDAPITVVLNWWAELEK